MKARLSTDGGARGNPGPAAYGYVLEADDGTVLDARGETIGTATNNVAEYRGLLAGFEAALEGGVEEVEVISDSELVVKQMRGEYKALLLGIERAVALGADEIELVGDSELVVKQVKGEYKVKDATMRELHAEVKEALRSFDSWSIRHVRREHNAEADRLVNEALDSAA